MHIVIVCIFVFFAGFVDSIAGGGGLISLPAYFFIGLPTLNACATNKFSAAAGTTFATIKFSRSKALDWSVALIAAVASFGFSYFASSIALRLNEDVLKLIIVIILPIVALFLFLKKDFGANGTEKPEEKNFKMYALAFFIGMIIGFYDGLIGPGTGTFAIIGFSTFMHYDLLHASGNAKVLNLASNYASAIRFLMDGKVILSIAVPAALCGIAGNWLGSTLAIKKGNSFIKIIMLAVMIILFVKMILDISAISK